jgi:hypothetical protein
LRMASTPAGVTCKRAMGGAIVSRWLRWWLRWGLCAPNGRRASQL